MFMKERNIRIPALRICRFISIQFLAVRTGKKDIGEISEERIVPSISKGEDDEQYVFD